MLEFNCRIIFYLMRDITQNYCFSSDPDGFFLLEFLLEFNCRIIFYLMRDITQNYCFSSDPDVFFLS